MILKRKPKYTFNIELLKNEILHIVKPYNTCTNTVGSLNTILKYKFDTDHTII